MSRHGFAAQKCFAPASDGFPSDFWFSSRRRAGARQGEKDKKRRKGALAGVFALVNRWYPLHIRFRPACWPAQKKQASRLSKEAGGNIWLFPL